MHDGDDRDQPMADGRGGGGAAAVGTGVVWVAFDGPTGTPLGTGVVQLDAALGGERDGAVAPASTATGWRRQRRVEFVDDDGHAVGESVVEVLAHLALGICPGTEEAAGETEASIRARLDGPGGPLLCFSTALVSDLTPWSAYQSGHIEHALVAPALLALIDAEHQRSVCAGLGRAVNAAHRQSSDPLSEKEHHCDDDDDGDNVKARANVERLRTLEARLCEMEARLQALTEQSVCVCCSRSLSTPTHDVPTPLGPPNAPAVELGNAAKSACGEVPADIMRSAVRDPSDDLGSECSDSRHVWATNAPPAGVAGDSGSFTAMGVGDRGSQKTDDLIRRGPTRARLDASRSISSAEDEESEPAHAPCGSDTRDDTGRASSFDERDFWPVTGDDIDETQSADATEQDAQGAVQAAEMIDSYTATRTEMDALLLFYQRQQQRRQDLLAAMRNQALANAQQ